MPHNTKQRALVSIRHQNQHQKFKVNKRKIVAVTLQQYEENWEILRAGK